MISAQLLYVRSFWAISDVHQVLALATLLASPLHVCLGRLTLHAAAASLLVNQTCSLWKALFHLLTMRANTLMSPFTPFYLAYLSNKPISCLFLATFLGFFPAGYICLTHKFVWLSHYEVVSKQHGKTKQAQKCYEPWCVMIPSSRLMLLAHRACIFCF